MAMSQLAREMHMDGTSDVPLVFWTRKMRTPSGIPVTVNNFDYNLAHCADGWVECTLPGGEIGHIKARSLTNSQPRA